MIIQAGCHYNTYIKHPCCIKIPIFYSCSTLINCSEILLCLEDSCKEDLLLPLPGPITNFNSTDIEPGQITHTWAASTDATSYNLYSGTTLIQSNVISPHIETYVGTRDYHVEAVNTEGVELSNIDSGTGVWVAVMFDATITSPVEPTVNSVTGGTMLYDDNLDGTWHVYTADPVTAVKWQSNTDITGFVANAGNTLTSMHNMFLGCSGLTALDVTSLDTAQVTIMNSTFLGCSGLTALDVTSFDTAQVTIMTNMFKDCSGLTALDLTSFDTSQVTNMASIFQGCSGLTALDVTSFDTAQVTNMAYMFYRCSSLTALDLTSFDTAQVTDMSFMFRDCSNLTCISNIDTTNVPTMTTMFTNTPALIQPDAAAITDITDTNGADWVHPTTCP